MHARDVKREKEEKQITRHDNGEGACSRFFGVTRRAFADARGINRARKPSPSEIKRHRRNFYREEVKGIGGAAERGRKCPGESSSSCDRD